MDPWHRRRPQRLVDELRAVQDSGLTLRFERLPGDLVGWRGTLEVDGRPHFLQVVYPPDFPARPPWVRETESLTEQIVDDQSTFHQMVDGSLCLFAMGTGPDAWAPSFTVRDVIARYVEFRRVADARGHVDEHGHPGPRAPGWPTGVVLQLTPGQRELMRLPGGRGWVLARPLLGRPAFVAERVSADPAGLDVGQDLAPWAVHGPGPSLVLPWVSVSCARWEELVPDVAALDALLAERLGAPSGAAGVRSVVLVEASGDPVRLLWLECPPLPGALAPLLRHEVRVGDLPDQLFARVDGAMGGREALAAWRVVMVGLGSLGGSVAVQLARAGVSRFALFDPGRVEPENIVRHVAGMSLLYTPKVVALEMLLRDRNPTAEVVRFASSPLWDGAPEASAAFSALLAAPDTLFVVTTADGDVERAVNELAHLHGRPVIFGSVVGQAEQGRVQRVLPGETPCYLCVGLQQQRHPGRFFRAKDLAPGGPPAAAGYHQPGIPGIGMDVDAVAILTARLVLQTLARLGGGSPDYPDAEHHHLVWTARADEAFDHPLQVRWEPYARDPACPVCAGGPAGVAEGAPPDLAALVEALSDPARLVLGEVPPIGPSPPRQG
jgi:molybdopterin/thiamine biosynthesis adenylyltransferase